MKTVTVSMRLPASEAKRLERACEAYRRGEVTLSRAAEIADLSIREMIIKLRDQDVTLSYGPDELATDLQSP